MTKYNTDHIKEALTLVSLLREEGINGIADEIYDAIRYSSTGLEIVFTLLSAVTRAKESHAIKSHNILFLMDKLIVDLKKKAE